MCEFTDGEKKKMTIEHITPPENWAWTTTWQLDTNRACDEEGKRMWKLLVQ